MDIELWAEFVDHVRGHHQGETRSLDHSHPCCKVWRSRNGEVHMGDHKPPRFAWAESGSVVKNEASQAVLVSHGVAAEPVSDEIKKYFCPRGHSFSTSAPIVVAVDNDPDYNTGPICGYCYVDWFKVNLNADEVTEL